MVISPDTCNSNEILECTFSWENKKKITPQMVNKSGVLVLNFDQDLQVLFFIFK